MARPREFDIEEATERAMEVFWTRGCGAALPELLSGMGIARGSLYKAFRDKQALFLEALRRYETVVLAPSVAQLRDPLEPDGGRRIAAAFEAALARARAGDRRGCLLCMAASDPAADDPEVRALTHRLLRQLTEGFEAALAAGPRAKATAARDAPVFTALYMGYRALERSRAPIATLEATVAGICAFAA